MNKPLYELTGDMLSLVNRYNEAETDEELLALETELTNTQMSFDDKAVAVIKFTLNETAIVPAIEAEIERLQQRKQSVENRAKRLSEYVKRSMEALGQSEIKTPTMVLKIVKNPASVKIVEGTVFSDKYMRVIPEHKEPDKKAIKEEVEKGVGVSGAELVQTTRLKIK